MTIKLILDGNRLTAGRHGLDLMPLSILIVAAFKRYFA